MTDLAEAQPTLYHLRSVVQVGRRVRNRGLFARVVLINRDGSVRPSASPYPLVVKFPEAVAELVTPGSVWHVDGAEVTTSYMHNGDRRYERTIKATRATFIKPTGQTLARWLRDNVDGIGEVLSNRLVRHKQLEKWVQAGDRAALLAIEGMTEHTVIALLEQWPSPALLQVIDFLDLHGIPTGISRAILRALGEDALQVIQSHPFMLLGLGISYEKVAALAQQLGFGFDDPEVIAGIAAHVAFVHSEETGSTVIEASELHSRAERLAKRSMPQGICDIAVEEKLMAKVGEGAYQSYGCALMEHEIALFLVETLFRRPDAGAAQDGWWETKIDRHQAIQALQTYEREKLAFPLLPKQRDAVIGSLLAPLCGISGGAGTGKTTILRAVLGCYELLAPHLPTFQVAISGRAAQRIAGVTHKPAQTIAKLIAEHMGENKPAVPDHLLLIIDESSMVDLLSMYRLARFLPYAVRIIFVGDVMQLVPVGKGLVFHELQASGVPFFELTAPMRQERLSGIHRFATDLRNGVVALPPRAASNLAACADCSIQESTDPNRLAELWLQAGGVRGGIVLCPVNPGPLGVVSMNRLLQKTVGLDRARLFYFDKARGLMPWVTKEGLGFLEGDQVLVVKNNYDDDADLRNGDLAILERVGDGSDDECFGTLRMDDGRRIEITMEVMEKLTLGYAVTIHKAQGSQWPTCFITLPGNAKWMIDQSLLYTAVTRAEKRVVLFGDPRLIAIGINRGPASKERVTTLAARIQHLTKLREVRER